MADEKKTQKGGATIHTSYVGTFDKKSLKKDDKGVVSATLNLAGENGGTKVVKGYNDHAKTLEGAVAAGDEIIVRGALLGGAKNPHMSIYGTGPDQVAGVVHKVRSNLDTYEAAGKMPYVNAFVKMERGDKTIGLPVVAYGDDALSLAGIEEGGRMDIPARPTQEKRTVQGEDQWVKIMRATGAGSVSPAPAKTEDAPAP